MTMRSVRPDCPIAGVARAGRPAASAARPKADAGNADHIGAPMPGVIATVAAQAGAKVKAGELLLTIEAMKMETGLHADRDTVVTAVHVQPGGQIDAKGLLIELE